MTAIVTAGFAGFVSFLFISWVRYLESISSPTPVGRAACCRQLVGVGCATLGVDMASSAALVAWCGAADDCSVTLLLSTSLNAVGELAVTVVCGAAVEEMLFRGFMLNVLAPRLGRPCGNAAQALLFGLLHALPYGTVLVVLPLTVMGFVAGLIALRSRAIWPAVTFHAAWNLSAVVAAQPYEESAFSRREDLQGFSPLIRVGLRSAIDDPASATTQLFNSAWFVALSSSLLLVLAYLLMRRLLVADHRERVVAK